MVNSGARFDQMPADYEVSQLLLSLRAALLRLGSIFFQTKPGQPVFQLGLGLELTSVSRNLVVRKSLFQAATRRRRGPLG